MRQYIVNLTDNLIDKNRFDEVFRSYARNDFLDEFVQHVKIDLEVEVRRMNPETLGRIMGSFEIGDVMVSNQELFNGVSFSGNCEELLRELVSLCLAYAIRNRIEETHLPRYRPRRAVARFASIG